MVHQRHALALDRAMQRRVAAVLASSNADGWALMRDIAAELNVQASYTMRAWRNAAAQAGFAELRQKADERAADTWRITAAGERLLDDAAPGSNNNSNLALRC